MNILIANTQEFNPQIGGVERVSSVLASEFQKKGHNVFFLSYYKSPFSKKYTPIVEQFFLPVVNGIICEKNELYFLDVINKCKIDILINQAANIEDFSELCFKVKKRSNIQLISAMHINPDFRIIGLSSYKSLSFMKKCNPRILRRILVYPSRKRKLLKQTKSFYSRLYSISDRVILLSDRFIPKFLELAGISESAKLTSIANPVPFDIENKLFDKKKQVLFVGRMDCGHKRPDLLLQIWNKIEYKFPDWKLVMVGDGPDISQIKSLATKLKLKQVTFKGFVDPIPYYQESEILCMTSQIEGFGMVLIEGAMFGAIPMAFASFASLSDIIRDDGFGFKITPFDIDKYACQLENLIRNLDLRLQIRSSLPEIVDLFRKERIVSTWDQLFNTLTIRK